jgi:DNA-binding PadR family transcriptional regulator
MNVELIVLGMLMEEKLCGYDIRKKTEYLYKDISEIKFGSIYYALDKSLKKELIKITGQKKDSGTPEKTIYEILPAGRKYYKKLLREYFAKSLIHFNADIHLMFLAHLSEEQKEEFHSERINMIKDKIAEIKEKSENTPDDDIYKHVLGYLDHHLKAEMTWLKSLDIE